MILVSASNSPFLKRTPFITKTLPFGESCLFEFFRLQPKFADSGLSKCYLVILSVELCLEKLWEIPSSHAQNYFNQRKNARVLGIPKIKEDSLCQLGQKL
jgi:hypothetical protein